MKFCKLVLSYNYATTLLVAETHALLLFLKIGYPKSVAKYCCPITETCGLPAIEPYIFTYFLGTTCKSSFGVSVIFRIVKAEPLSISGTNFLILSSTALLNFSSCGSIINFYLVNCKVGSSQVFNP